MTSVVDTSTKWFSNVMTGAPALPGQTGAQIALLDAVLTNGFDSKLLSSLVVAGGIATAAYTGGHSALPDSVVLISGVTGGPSGFAALNGEQKIVAKPTLQTVTFATNAADGDYTGTIAMKMAPLGWAKPFSGTNLAAYKSTDPLSSGFFLRVDDTNATVTRVIGYESMSDINTGVGPFPTQAQIAGGGYWPKSTIASAAPVNWVIVGDSRAFVIHVMAGYVQSATYVGGATRGFGDAIALRPGGDPYATFLCHSVQPSSGSMNDNALDAPQSAAGSSFARSYAALGGAQGHFCLPYTGSNTTSGLDSLFGDFPSEVDGSLRLSRRYFARTTSVAPRAEMPGLYSVPQAKGFLSFRTGDRVPGAGAVAGRTMLALNPMGANLAGTPNESNCGVSFVDITGPWR